MLTPMIAVAMSMHPDTDGSDSDLGTRSGIHWWCWVLGILAVPVVYVLSLPAVAVSTRYVVGFDRPAPAWLSLYGKPCETFAEYTGLEDMKQDYDLWWYDLISKL
jgi:hypothetical protein